MTAYTPLRTTLLVLLTAAGLMAAPLTGSGSAMPLPADTGNLSPGIAPVITTIVGGFQGTWSSPYTPDWNGTFTATGAYPSNTVTGTSRWDFTGMPNNLPAGTFVRFGDLDNGESFTLRAYTAANTLITSAWLDEPTFLSSLTPADLTDPLAMSSWSLAGGLYTFNGNSGIFNHTVTVTLPTNTAIGYLEVGKGSINDSFGLAAPVPEPATFAIAGLGLIAVAVLRRRNDG